MKNTLLLFLITSFSTVIAQTRITGKVTDGNGQPVPMANIFLKDTYDGTTADGDGNFSFVTDEKGEHTIIARLIGFKESHIPVRIAGESVSVNFELREEISELKAVTISAGAFAASDESRRTVFRAVDIATTAGATADIAGALNTLPGTQKNGESGRLFVRGGDGNEAKTFIDGLLVLDAYRPSAPNTPSRGRFLPFMFKGTSFSTGGYSAEYGQALSSTLALESRDEGTLTRTDLGLLSLGGDVTHTQTWEGGSIGGKVQYTNLTPYTNLINQEIDWKSAPVSLEGIGSFRQRLTKTGIVKVYGNFNRSSFSLYNHDIDDPSQTQLFKLTNNYNYVNASYKGMLKDDWIIRGGAAYTHLANLYKIENHVIDETEKGAHAKVVVEGSVSDHVDLKTGVEVFTRNFSQALTPFNAPMVKTGFEDNITAAFAEADLYASNNFVTRAGVRGEHNSLTGKASADPRISLAYKVGSNGQVSLAWGKFRQTAKNEWLKLNTSLEGEKADHYILNYQRIENNRTFRVETYYKKYDNLVKVQDGVVTNHGNGYAQGVEVFWRDNESVSRLDYWISYSFLDTKRNYLNFPTEATPTFASKHNFSVVGKYFIEKMKSQLGATFSYTSPRPYNNPNESTFNGGKTPSYQDLSFTWSYLPKPNLIVFFSCTNLLGRDNIFGYEYGKARNEDGLYNSRAIRQPAPRFLFLGIFLTISKDKSVNQLPTL
ncbi:MAG TPA: TonB-dependent receptor [Chryseosolibacter sp.]